MSTDLDPGTIAADIMCGNARSITPAEVWAHIGQAYDTAEVDASIADEVADLIAKTGIDLLWPDGTKNTELDAARVEIERLRQQVDSLSTMFGDAQDRLTEARAELAKVREQVFAQKPVIEAAQAWAELHEDSDVRLIRRRSAAPAVADLYDAIEQYRLMDLTLTSARDEQAEVAR